MFRLPPIQRPTSRDESLSSETTRGDSCPPPGVGALVEAREAVGTCAVGLPEPCLQQGHPLPGPAHLSHQGSTCWRGAPSSGGSLHLIRLTYVWGRGEEWVERRLGGCLPQLGANIPPRKLSLFVSISRLWEFMQWRCLALEFHRKLNQLSSLIKNPRFLIKLSLIKWQAQLCRCPDQALGGWEHLRKPRWCWQSRGIDGRALTELQLPEERRLCSHPKALGPPPHPRAP